MSDKFPRWNEPATVGEVLTAMVWAQGLLNRVMAFAVAATLKERDEKKIAEAFAAYQSEWEEFNEKLRDIGGRVTNDGD